MPKKSIHSSINQADLNAEDMQRAIIKIDKRLEELRSFDGNNIDPTNDPRIDALGHKLEALLAEIYGINSHEYQKYSYISSLHPTSLNPFQRNINNERQQVKRNIERTINILETIKSLFEEKLEEINLDDKKRILTAYEKLELHPAIDKAASELYRNGHYSNAIEDAVKALNNLVRLNSGVDDKDGVPLMQHVFSPHHPILKFNSLSDESDRNEQQGFMRFFEGAVAGLRNPRAHKLIKDDPERALEFIAFISLLAKLADEAKSD